MQLVWGNDVGKNTEFENISSKVATASLEVSRFSYRPLRTLDFCTVFITEHEVLLLEHAAKRHLSKRLF